jgi:hypothetical protein
VELTVAAKDAVKIPYEYDGLLHTTEDSDNQNSQRSKLKNKILEFFHIFDLLAMTCSVRLKTSMTVMVLARKSKSTMSGLVAERYLAVGNA